ncbi:MAG: cytochrome c oxidase subunit II [Ignavibacteriaceae bacterium]|jgi:cytochrome c oxidase subunit 2|nr:cytochrome c oxidase subunit II [Ignavibacteriaceae bacterium]
MFNGASNFAHDVDSLFLFTLIVSVFFLVLITGLLIYFVIKYNRKRNPKATNVHGSVKLEITWTLIPTILVLIMFWWGWKGYLKMSDIPENAMTIDVTAQMWNWSFKYANGKVADSLYVPVDKPIVLNLQSMDVVHAFYIPAFRIKKDVFPKQNRVVWFEADEIGDYDIACAEYCGLNHSYMYNKIKVVSEEDFSNWLYGSFDTETTK